MRRGKGHKSVRCIIGGLAALAAVLCIGCRADIFAGGGAVSAVEKQEEEGAELTAYQEFLDGSRSVYIEEDMLEELRQRQQWEWEMMDAQPSMLLSDFLDGINASFREWGFEHKIGRVEYAYVDCGGDGKQELAVRISGFIPSDHLEWTLLLVCEDGNLFLRQIIDSWARSRVTLYDHGYLAYEGSSGAPSQYLAESFIGGNGELLPIWEAEIGGYIMSYAEILEEAGEKEGHVSIKESTYTIAGKEYIVFEEDGEDVSEEQWEQFYALYNLEYGSGYTQEEVEALIRSRRSALGIPEEWLEEREPQWQSLKNPLYKEQIREVALQESRVARRKESDSVLRDKWTACTWKESRDTYFDGSFAF